MMASASTYLRAPKEVRMIVCDSVANRVVTEVILHWCGCKEPLYDLFVDSPVVLKLKKLRLSHVRCELCKLCRV